MPAMHARRHWPDRLALGSLRRRNPRDDLSCRFSDLYGDFGTEQVVDVIACKAGRLSEPRFWLLSVAPSMTIGIAAPR